MSYDQQRHITRPSVIQRIVLSRTIMLIPVILISEEILNFLK